MTMTDTPSDTPTGSAAERGPECASDSSSGNRSLALRLIDWYQRTFTGGPPTCRFFPSCSSYAREALEVHGTPRGLWLTARRLLRCRPFGPSGVDPVPEPRAPRSSDSGKVA